MEQWISIETANFAPHAMKFIAHHVFNHPQEPAVLEAAGKGVEAALTVMDVTLAKTPFLAGTDFGLADVVFMPYLEYGMATPVKEMLAKYLHANAWWDKISERPTWHKTVGRA